MKAVRAEQIGSVDDYVLVDVDAPIPRANEVQIKVHSCGMGYVDALVALGGYQVKPHTPFIPGLEIGGTISAVGQNVSKFNIGDRVMASLAGGGLAEFAIANEASTWRLSNVINFAQAAGFRTNYVTALHGLVDRADVKPRERLLVFGASGGVGTAAVQVGKLLGAEVIAAASTDEKRDYARARGADYVLDTEPEGWRDRLRGLCGGGGPNVIFDPVCGPLFEAAFRSQAWGGGIWS